MKLVRESINFERRLNPKHSIGIGKKFLIDEWFRTWAPDVRYEVDDNLNIIIKESLNLNNSSVKELPDNLTINDGLYLDNTPIKELPNNLIVKNDLNLSDTFIKELPEDIFVGALYI